MSFVDDELVGGDFGFPEPNVEGY